MNVTIGAIMKTTRFAVVGMIVSLNTSLTPSAIGCSNPQGPTTFGPRLIWTAAMTLRSAKVRYATASSRTRMIRIVHPA
jgi:hypothetical protein